MILLFKGDVMNIKDIIKKKRDQKELTDDEIKYFVSEYSNGNIPDYQISSLLMAIYLNGMSEDEIFTLTMEMANSGEILDLSSIEGPIVDKHSTGGIGDKVTLVVLPLVASCGVNIAKMSGRGLGYTQGTIDKLESINGFRTNLFFQDFISNIKDIGIAIMSQSEDIAVADKKLYALRDVTSTVESIPLIASSIMSKKIAAGADKFLLEVTCGSGAFMASEERAKLLGEIMVNIGEKLGKETVAIITNMDQPLGRYCGNALEVKEAIEILKGKGEDDVVSVCTWIGAYMLKLAGKGENIANNIKMIQNQIKNGEGLKKFKQLIALQGGDVNVIDYPELLDTAPVRLEVPATHSGFVSAINAKVIGEAVVRLGGGRLKKDDEIDNSVGIEVCKKIGDEVKSGDTILIIHSSDEQKARLVIESLQEAYNYSDEQVDKYREIIDII
jgi:pyrimidine-nucleoside phosphorylase